MECPECGQELNSRDYNDGGDPPQSPPYYFWNCYRCGWFASDDRVYEDEENEEGDFYE